MIRRVLSPGLWLVICTLFLLFARYCWAEPHTIVYTRAEQITVPIGLPRSLAWEVLRARVWLHTLHTIQLDLLQRRHIAGNFSEEDVASLAAVTYVFTVHEEERARDTVTAHLSASPSTPQNVRAASQHGLLPLVRSLIVQTETQLLLIDAHWPSGHIYVDKYFTEQEEGGTKNRWPREAWEHAEENLRALRLALHAVTPTDDGWFTKAKYLHDLEEATRLREHDPDILLLQAECRLQNKLPQQAIASASHALRLAPNLARARYIRALAHWQLQQHGLAENDLSLILEQENLKRNGEKLLPYLRARGALRLVLGKHAEMCADFRIACRLGDCEGLEHARRENLCPSLSAPN